MTAKAHELANLIKEFDEKLSPLFDKAIEARDAAQETASAIAELKQNLLKL